MLNNIYISMLRNNIRDRSTIKLLNDRQNFIKLVKSREFNLERQKELKKILQEQNKKLFDLQNQKVKKLKQSRGKNLRGELARNKNLQRRFERGERRYAETQEPRIIGDPQVVVAGGGGQAPMTQEDRQLALARLQVQAQQNQFNFQLQDRRDREELAIRRGEAQGNLLLGQQRLAQDQEDQRGRRAIEEGNARLQAAISEGNLRGDQFRLQREDIRGNRQLDLEDERNRLRALEIQNDRDIREEENAIRRLQLEARRENIPIPEIEGGERQPFNIGDHQFFGNLLTGLAQDRHREREATQNIIRQFQDHQERLGGGLSEDIFNQLFHRAKASGLRVVGEEPPPPPYPQPDSSVIILPDKQPSIRDVASEVRSILRAPAEQPEAENRNIEGTQTHGALTELEFELAQPSENPQLSNVERFLEGATSDAPPEEADEVSSITFSEWGRRLNTAEQEYENTSIGIANTLESERFNRENPYVLVDNPLDQLVLTPSETDLISRPNTERLSQLEENLEELQSLRQQGITTDRLSQLQESLEEEQIEIGEQEEEFEEGAGIGVIQQAGEALGQGLVSVAGGVAQAGLGVIQGAGEAIIEQLPTPSQVGQAIGRGAVAGGGAVLGAAASAVGGIAEAVVGGGDVEDIGEQELLVDVEPTDEGELLEEIPISTQNPAQISDDDFDYGDFMVHHEEQSDKQRPPTLLERSQGAKYSISNTSDRVHKKLNPGEKVDITNYGKDKKGESIGFYGELNPASNRREGLPTQLQLKALNKSIDKGYLKLHKNY